MEKKDIPKKNKEPQLGLFLCLRSLGNEFSCWKQHAQATLIKPFGAL